MINLRTHFKDYFQKCLFFSIFVMGCSPSSFFGGGKDENVLKIRQYRKVNPNCANMNLKNSEIDVQTFRSLLKCLNSDGILDKSDAFLDLLDDDHVQPLVRFLNHYVMKNASRIYEIDQTYQTFVKKQVDEEAFTFLGDLLENRELVASLLILLKSGYYIPRNSQSFGNGRIMNSSDSTPDQKILVAFKLLMHKIDDQSFREILDQGLLMAKAPAFRSLEKHFLDPIQSSGPLGHGANEGLKLVTGISDYLREDHTFKCEGRDEKISKELAYLFSTGRVFPMMNELLGQTAVDIAKKAPELNHILKGLMSFYSNPGLELGPHLNTNLRLMNGLSEAFRELGGPIECMDGAKSIPDATRYLIREMVGYREPSDSADYIGYDAPLMLKYLSPFCKFPDRLQVHFQSLIALAESGVTAPLFEKLKILYGKEANETPFCASSPGYTGEPVGSRIDFLIHVLADSGVTSIASNTPRGIHRLIPVLADFEKREIFPDLMLLATTPNSQDQVLMNEAFSFLMQSQEQLNQESIFDVFINAASRAHPLDFYRLIKSVGVFLEKDNKRFFENALTTLRKIHYLNEASPFLGLVREFASEATEVENVKLFETFFYVVQAHESEFLDSVEEISVLAKSKREKFKILIESLLNLYRQFSLQGKKDIRETEAPSFTKEGQHHLQPGDLTSVDEIQKVIINEDCKLLDLNFRMDQVSDPKFNDEIGRLLRCKASRGGEKTRDFEQAFNFLTQEKTKSSEGFLAFQVQKISEFMRGFEEPETNYLVNQWMQTFTLKGKPLLDKSKSASSSKKGDVYQPSQEEILEEDKNSFVRLLNAANFWVKPSHPIQNLEFSVGASPSPSPSQQSASSIIKPLLRAVGPMVSNAETLRDIEELEYFGAKVLRDKNFPSLFSDARDLFTRIEASRENAKKLEPSPKPLPEQVALDEIYTPELREVLKVWVKSVEVWRFSGNNEHEIDTRVTEIIDQSRNRVTTYDLEGYGIHKKPHLAWGFADLKGRVISVLDRLGDASKVQHSNEGLPLDAFLNFVKTVSKPNQDDVAPFKKDHFWARRSPQELLRMFHKRARRVRPRIQFYKGDKNPYVVLDSDLDLFEKSLFNVHMVLPIPPHKNLAWEFGAEIANAWGDLPRNQWPMEIQRKYPGGRPPTLSEAVEGIISRPPDKEGQSLAQIIWFFGNNKVFGKPENLSRFIGFEDLQTLSTKLVGLPNSLNSKKLYQHFPGSKPNTFRMVALPEGLNKSQYQEADIPNYNAYGDFFVTVPGLQSFIQWSQGGPSLEDMQGQLFNLWQSIDVLRENVPKSVGSTPADDDGGMLQVMRDLFFEVYYSSPEKIHNQSFPAADSLNNNLTLVTQVIELGLMHQLGAQLQRFQLNDPELDDFILSVIRASSSPGMRSVFTALLKKSREGELKSRDGKPENYEFILKILEIINQTTPIEAARIKELLYYLLASLNKFEPWDLSLHETSQVSGSELFLDRVSEILNSDDFYNFLARAKIPVAIHSQGPGSPLLKALLTSDMTDKVSSSLYAMMSEPGHSQRSAVWSKVLRDFLQEMGSDSNQQLLTRLFHLSKGLVENADSWNSFIEFGDRVDALHQSSSYKELNIQEVIRPILDFIGSTEEGVGSFQIKVNGVEKSKVEKNSKVSSEKFKVADKLRQNLSQFMLSKGSSGSNALNEILILAHQKPEDFDRVLKVFSESIENRDLVEFFKVIRRSLPE